MNTENQNNEDLGSDIPPAQISNEEISQAEVVRSNASKDQPSKSLVIPGWISLTALIVAGFLLFPAYKGFKSGREKGILDEQLKSANQSLALSKAQIAKLENEIYQVGLQGQGRRLGDHLARGLGLFVSPLLSLEQKKSGLPDLIRIDFRQREEAVLAFEAGGIRVEELQMSIFQEGNLVWLQTVPIPRKTLFNQNLITFVLSRDTLGPGKYRIKMDGNPSREKTPVSEFDLWIEI